MNQYEAVTELHKKHLKKRCEVCELGEREWSLKFPELKFKRYIWDARADEHFGPEHNAPSDKRRFWTVCGSCLARKLKQDPPAEPTFRVLEFKKPAANWFARFFLN